MGQQYLPKTPCQVPSFETQPFHHSCCVVGLMPASFLSFFFFIIKVEFTSHNVNHCKVNNLVAFTMLCNRYLCLVLEHFCHSKKRS